MYAHQPTYWTDRYATLGSDSSQDNDDNKYCISNLISCIENSSVSRRILVTWCGRIGNVRACHRHIVYIFYRQGDVTMSVSNGFSLCGIDSDSGSDMRTHLHGVGL